jgi:hypothetical protein
MQQASRWYLSRAAVVVAGLALSVYACTDQPYPVAPATPTPGPVPPSSTTPIQLAKLECKGSVSAKSVVCEPATPPVASPGSVSADIIYAGQNTLVQVKSVNPEYDATTQKFTFGVTVRNLIPQSIGTTDGTTADQSGVKVFFGQEPTVTSGSGVITIDNADGVDTFTSPNQPYFAYVSRIDQFQVSSAKTWQFDIPSTVNTFSFILYVSSPVQFPTGWIETSVPAYSLRRTFTKLVTGTVRDQFGTVIPGAVVTWSSPDATLATVLPDSGYVTGRLPGSVSIVATSTNTVPGTVNATQTGAAVFTITGTSLTWTAGAGNTDWNNPGNWDRAVSPVALDSATIPVVGSSLYPAFTANQQIGRVIVNDAAQIDLGAFDLTASQDAVSAASVGGISGTSGRLLLTGSSKVTTGRMPHMRISGTYSMTGNITAVAPFRVDLGRLRNTAFRLRVTSQ